MSYINMVNILYPDCDVIAVPKSVVNDATYFGSPDLQGRATDLSSLRKFGGKNFCICDAESPLRMEGATRALDNLEAFSALQRLQSSNFGGGKPKHSRKEVDAAKALKELHETPRTDGNDP